MGFEKNELRQAVLIAIKDESVVHPFNERKDTCKLGAGYQSDHIASIKFFKWLRKEKGIVIHVDDINHESNKVDINRTVNGIKGVLLYSSKDFFQRLENNIKKNEGKESQKNLFNLLKVGFPSLIELECKAVDRFVNRYPDIFNNKDDFYRLYNEFEEDFKRNKSKSKVKNEPSLRRPNKKQNSYNDDCSIFYETSSISNGGNIDRSIITITGGRVPVALLQIAYYYKIHNGKDIYPRGTYGETRLITSRGCLLEKSESVQEAINGEDLYQDIINYMKILNKEYDFEKAIQPGSDIECNRLQIIIGSSEKRDQYINYCKQQYPDLSDEQIKSIIVAVITRKAIDNQKDKGYPHPDFFAKGD